MCCSFSTTNKTAAAAAALRRAAPLLTAAVATVAAAAPGATLLPQKLLGQQLYRSCCSGHCCDKCWCCHSKLCCSECRCRSLNSSTVATAYESVEVSLLSDVSLSLSSTASKHATFSRMRCVLVPARQRKP